MISDNDLPPQPDTLEQQPPLNIRKKAKSLWKVIFILLFAVNIIFYSWAEYILSNIAPNMVLRLAGPILILPVAFIDLIVLLSYLIRQRPQGRAKIVGYTILIAVTFILLSVAWEVKGDPSLEGRNDIDPLLDTFFGKPIHKPCLPPESIPISPGRLGHPGKTIPGQVTVELAKPIFHRGECVQVRIANGLHYSVYAYAWNTGCTIVSLERRWLIGWREAAGCATRGLDDARYFRREIGTGEVVEVALNPYDYRLLAYHMKPPGFGVWIYRIVFPYWPSSYLADTTYLAPTTTVTSPAFVVIP